MATQELNRNQAMGLLRACMKGGSKSLRGRLALVLRYLESQPSEEKPKDN